MRVAVTGSIATDHLMTFPGRFAEQLLPDRLGQLSVSFLVDQLVIRRGGVAANICFGMGQLGLHPLLVGAVGSDFADYRSWLDRAGVDTSGVLVSTAAHTARFLCTTDRDQNQIASFYPGAMSEASGIELAVLADRAGGLDLVVVGPNHPAAMTRHTLDCRKLGLPFAADPSQQLSSLDGEAVRDLIDGAAYLFSNEYETALLTEKTGWPPDRVLESVRVWVQTHGPAGVTVRSARDDPVRVPAVRPRGLAEPTGAGDAFRAGYLTGRVWALSDQDAARVGCLLATLALESVGTQEYRVDPAGFVDRLADNYGPETAGRVAGHLRRQPVRTAADQGQASRRTW